LRDCNIQLANYLKQPSSFPQLFGFFFIMKHYKKDQCYYKVITSKTIIIYDFELLPTVSVTSFIDLQDATEIDPREFDDAFYRVTNHLKQLCYEN